MSPKNKGKFGKAKSSVEVKDEFVSGVSSVADRLAPHLRRIVSFAVAFVLVMVGVMAWRSHQRGEEAEATERLSRALAVYADPVVSAEQKALFDQLRGQIPSLPETTYASLADRAQLALGDLAKLESELGSSTVAESSELFRAGVLYDAGRYEQALSAYRAFAASDAPARQRTLAREGIGYALEAQALAQTEADKRKAGLEAALAAFKSVQENDEGFYRDYALYHQARVLENLGRTEEAKALYNEVLDKFPGSELRRVVDARLAMLGAGYPSSFPATAAPAAADGAAPSGAAAAGGAAVGDSQPAAGAGGEGSAADPAHDEPAE